MLIESKLLDENKVLISTGLGGKGFKLRYFVVLFSKDEKEFGPFQQKIIRNELTYAIKKVNGELEEITFHDHLATVISVIPLHVSVQDLFYNIIDECNILGNFLNSNYIITNLKILTLDEIHEILAENDIY